jgi:hypothetical protein
MDLKNYHLITVKYLPATNTRGSRVRLYSTRFNRSVIIPYNYSLNSITEMAAEYLTKNGHKIAGQAEGKKEDYLILSAIKNEFKTF